MSYIEIKKFHIADLLNPDGPMLDSFSMKNVSSVKVRSQSEALKTLFKGI